MNRFNEKDLLNGFIKTHDSFIIDNANVRIVILNLGNELDLMEFYSRVNTKGIARCTLYYMLKAIMNNKLKTNSLKIGISAIVPSKPRRNIDSIKQTYQNIGFTNIVEDNITLTPTDLKLFGLSENDSTINEPILYCHPVPIDEIINKLAFCSNNTIPSNSISQLETERTKIRQNNREYVEQMQKFNDYVIKDYLNKKRIRRDAIGKKKRKSKKRKSKKRKSKKRKSKKI